MKPTKDSVRKYVTGIAGFLSLILIALLTLEVAVIAIAITLPLLVTTALIGITEKNWGRLEKKYRYFIIVFNLCGSIISLTAVFWHFLPIAGILFVIMTCLSFCIIGLSEKTKNKEKD